MDDDAIRAVVARLARAHPSGGSVIERATVLAEGSGSQDVMAWIIAHGGEPEAAVARASTRQGLHGTSDSAPQTPSRYVLPAGALD